MSIGERYKKLREMLGYSQADMATRIGSSQSYYSTVERGLVEPTPRHNRFLAMEFNVNLKWLETGEGEIFNVTPALEEITEIFKKLDAKDQKHLIEIGRKLLAQGKDNEGK